MLKNGKEATVLVCKWLQFFFKLNFPIAYKPSHFKVAE